MHVHVYCLPLKVNANAFCDSVYRDTEKAEHRSTTVKKQTNKKTHQEQQVLLELQDY